MSNPRAMNLALATIAAVLSGVGGASASTCFSPGCTAGSEVKIFFDAAIAKSTTDHVGSQTGTSTETLSSSSTVDFANGFATIKPTGGPKSFFSDLTVTDNGSLTFTDFEYSLQLFGKKNGGFTVTAFDGGSNLGSKTYSGLKTNADLSFLITSSSPMTKVVFDSSTGFKEMKHFEVSGTGVTPPATPLPAALPLFMSGLALMGLVAARRRKRTAAAA